MDRSVIDENAASLDAMKATAARLSDEDLSQILEGGWTPAAYFAHMAFWDRRTLVLLDRWLRDPEMLSPIDFDAVNDAALPQWRMLDPRRAVNDALTVAELVNAAVASLSAEQLQAIVEAGAIRIDRARHRRAHLASLDAGAS